MRAFLGCFAAILGTVFLPCLAGPAPAAATVEARILVPVVDAKRQPVQQAAPDGKTYPVFRVAPDSPLVAHAREVLRTGFAQQVLRLDRYARNMQLWEERRHGAASAADEQRLSEPMSLLMSNEEGGFARDGFWLENAKGRQLIQAGYVDLVVDERSVADGDFDEIFSHELGHLILRALVGRIPDGPSYTMHMSMAVTDYPTAFDEGFAEQFQPLARDASENPVVRRMTKGAGATDLNLLWFSKIDQQLRTDGVKRNVFVHRKALPAAALEPHPNPYRVWLDSITSPVFLSDELKNGQQMMASESVIATLFYRIVNDERLAGHYRPADFYIRFLPKGEAPGNPENLFSPYENENLKLFAAMRLLAEKPLNAHHAPMIDLVEAYDRLFPDEASAMNTIFLETTYGATASQPLALAWERAEHDGGTGAIAAFRKSVRGAISGLRGAIAQVSAGKLKLDANLGPELWLLNDAFKIPSAVWQPERTLPLTFNLNSASVAELMTTPGIDLALARKIVAARDERGYFAHVDDLQDIVPPSVLDSFRRMSEQMKSAKPYQRP
jgi:hypothetical protein